MFHTILWWLVAADLVFTLLCLLGVELAKDVPEVRAKAESAIQFHQKYGYITYIHTALIAVGLFATPRDAPYFLAAGILLQLWWSFYQAWKKERIERRFPGLNKQTSGWYTTIKGAAMAVQGLLLISSISRG